jgi:hypothetical protein
MRQFWLMPAFINSGPSSSNKCYLNQYYGLSYDSEGDIIGALWAKIEQPQLLHVRIKVFWRQN